MGNRLALTATPDKKELTDAFGNVHRLGVLGIQRSASPDDWTLKRHDPLTAFVMAIKECYFVISRSLGYLYDVITGREAADQLGGPDPNRASVGTSCDGGIFCPAQSRRHHFGQHRADQSVPRFPCSMAVTCCFTESRRSAANL